jgi:uncharacterized membrane protein
MMRREVMMLYLILGLMIFLGAHSIRVVADPWRVATIARIGEGRWKGLYSLASLVGLVLIIWGYGQARLDPIVLWHPPIWTRHLAAPLTLVAFILVAAGNVPGTRIRARLGSPMVLGVKVWAFAHLMANGTLAAVVLFASFLLWAIVAFASARRRDRESGTQYPVGTIWRDIGAIVGGTLAWLLFAFYLHGLLIGVRPFG